jgi:hypothetical protein
VGVWVCGCVGVWVCGCVGVGGRVVSSRGQRAEGRGQKAIVAEHMPGMIWFRDYYNMYYVGNVGGLFGYFCVLYWREDRVQSTEHGAHSTEHIELQRIEHRA